VTTWILGRPDPIVTYSNDLWQGRRLLRVGPPYLAEGLVVCVRENPDYG
jgi:hypothetical protein